MPLETRWGWVKYLGENTYLVVSCSIAMSGIFTLYSLVWPVCLLYLFLTF